MSRNLVIFYSRAGQNYVGGEIVELEKGNAEQIADYIADMVDADVFEIRTVKDYPEDYNECTVVAKEEIRKNARPKLAEYLDDVDIYDNIFVVGPCWWGTYPMAVFTQLEKLNFRGKKVLPVITHEGSGLGSAEKDLRKMCKGAKVGKGLAVQGSRVKESEITVKEWAMKSVKHGLF